MTQIRCEVKGVFVTMNDATTVPLVVLTDGGEQSLPIFIGLWEAVSINSAKNKEVLSRPFTHDLFLDLIVKFSISVHYLQIDSIEDGVEHVVDEIHVGWSEEEVGACRKAPRFDVEATVEERLLKVEIGEAHHAPLEGLRHGEDVADVAGEVSS